MDNEKTLIASSVVELSEHPSYIELVDRVCYYDDSNANGVQLDYDESSLEKAQSLIDMPVVALYLSDREGKPTLGGHAVTRTRDGIKFGTSAIGVHTNVWIDDAEIETVAGEKKTAKCLFSTMKIWNRFENMVSAVKRLYSEGRLHNSWEISVNSYTFEDGIKKLKDYSFIGNALLGEAIPAYGSASAVLSMASVEDDDPQLLIAEALSADLVGSDSASNINQHQLDNSESDRKEMNPEMEANENIVVEESEVKTEEETVEVVEAEETVEVNTEEQTNNEEAEVSEGSESDESETEHSEQEESEAVESENTEAETEQSDVMNTDEDIRRKLYKAVDKLRDDKGDWYYVAMLFPEEKIVLVQNYNMPHLQFVQYSYEINDDEAVLSDRQLVEMTISPLNINSEIESKNSVIADANNRIVELENQVAELEKIKSEYDAIKAEQEKNEHAEAVNKLRKYVESSGRFTEEEIQSEEIQKAISELNETWLKAEIADRLVASLSKAKEVDVSETRKTEEVSIILSEEEKPVTSNDVMRAFFND